MYRIFTEDVNRPAIEQLTSELFDSFTLIPAQGHWSGNQENSLIIELDYQDRAKAELLARNIKAANKQEAVLLQEIPVTSQLI